MTALASPSVHTPGAVKGTGGTRRRAARSLPLAVPVVAVAVWQIATYVVDEGALPTPRATAAAFWDGVTEGWLTENLWITLRVVLVAFVLASIAGLAIGLGIGMSRFWSDVLGPPLLWTYSLPKVTIFPVFLLMFGLGDMSRMTFGAFHGFFPLAILVLAGVRATPPVYLRAARSLNLTYWETITRVIVPAALPSILSGLRFCFSLCFLGVVLAEMFGSSQGAGYELVRLITLQKSPEIFALALTLMATALLLNLLIMAVERRATSYSTINGKPTI